MGKQDVGLTGSKILLSDRRLGGDALLVRVAEALERVERRGEDGVVARRGLDEEGGAVGVVQAKETAGKKVLGVCEIRRGMARGRRVRERGSIKVGVVGIVEKVGIVHGIELGREIGLLLPRTGVWVGERRAVVGRGVRVVGATVDVDGGRGRRRRRGLVVWLCGTVSADLLFDRKWVVIGGWTATSEGIIGMGGRLHSISGAVVVEHRMEFKAEVAHGGQARGRWRADSVLVEYKKPVGQGRL